MPELPLCSESHAESSARTALEPSSSSRMRKKVRQDNENNEMYEAKRGEKVKPSGASLPSLYCHEKPSKQKHLPDPTH